MKFDAATRASLFGAEDAENENEERFKQYFYFNRAYDDVVSSLPLRILIGPKGVGKSALLKRSYYNNLDNKIPTMWLRPSDILPDDIDKDFDFNRRIDSWKKSINSAVLNYIVDNYTNFEGQIPTIVGKSLKALISVIREIANKKEANLDNAIVSFVDSKVDMYIYIDDIDRGWQATREDIANLSALINALRDLAGENTRMKFRLGIRSDVYYLVRTSDESTDKIEQHISWLQWNNDQILKIMAKRIVTYFDMGIDDEKLMQYRQIDISKNILSKIMEERFTGLGHWGDRPIHNVLMSLTRARPRDLVKLMHGAAKITYQRDGGIISSSDFDKSFPSYSEERLRDVINEFKSELPSIERLLLEMRPRRKERRAADSFKFTGDQLSAKLSGIRNNVSIIFKDDQIPTNKKVISFLYKIDFITARKDEDGKITRAYFDQSRMLAHENVDFGYDWEIHPAYRWALQPREVMDVIGSLEIED